MSLISQVNAGLASKGRFSTENTGSLLCRATFLLCAWQLFRVRSRFKGLNSWSDLLFLLTAGVGWTERGGINWHEVQLTHFATWLTARGPLASYSRPLIENLGEEFLQLLEDFRSVSRLGEAAWEQLYWLKNFFLELLVFDCEDSLLQYVVAELMHSESLNQETHSRL